MDLNAVRIFVAAADAGQFQEAAVELSITRQAVSKRIAALEKYLGVRLFARTARGAQLRSTARHSCPMSVNCSGSQSVPTPPCALAGACYVSVSSPGAS